VFQFAFNITVHFSRFTFHGFLMLRFIAFQRMIIFNYDKEAGIVVFSNKNDRLR